MCVVVVRGGVRRGARAARLLALTGPRHDAIRAARAALALCPDAACAQRLAVLELQRLLV